MTSRGITVLGLIQTGLVFAIIVAGRISARLVQTWNLPEDYALPRAVGFARHYGFWLLLVPIVWVLLATLTSQRISVSVLGFSIQAALGILVVLALTFQFAAVVVSPFVPLILDIVAF